MCEHQKEIIEELRWVMMELSGDVGVAVPS